MQPASLVFEGAGLMAFEIRPTIDMAISELQGMVDNEDLVEVDSMLRFFNLKLEMTVRLLQHMNIAMQAMNSTSQRIESTILSRLKI